MVNETQTWGKKPNIKRETLEELTNLLAKVYPNKWRYCVDVMPKAALKTIDNEADAKITIANLKDFVSKGDNDK